ncbi:MAG: UDP-2,3-diacylglucosamine diphosphatase [Gammaproteobacteria bacterium]
MSTLFISDLHLSPQRPHLSQLFFKFLQQQAPQADTLYILGDFFNIWIGDDDTSAFHRSISEPLKALAATGVTIYIMVGNHDFLLGKKFCQASGCTLLPDPAIIDLYGHKTLLKHGDDLCVEDKRYLRYRKIARSWLIRNFYLTLPIRLRRSMANKIRSISKNNKKVHQQGISDIPREMIPITLAKHQVQQFIHGHTHRPAIHYLFNSSQPQRHIVLSDWGKTGNFCMAEPNGEMRLAYF